jgi:hypothetical protein
MPAEHLAELLHLARERERRDAERHLQELAQRAELRDHWKTRLPDRPALGAFDPPARALAPFDPARLTAIVLQMARFTDDDEILARSAAQLATRLGVAEDDYIEPIADGIRAAVWRRAAQ